MPKGKKKVPMSRILQESTEFFLRIKYERKNVQLFGKDGEGRI